MAWSDAARRAAIETRKRKSKRYSLSPSGRLNDPGSFKPATLKGANVAEARARNTKLMVLRNQRRNKGEKFYGTPQVLGRVKFPARAIPNSKLWVSLNPKAKR